MATSNASAATSNHTFHLDLPGSGKKVGVEMELVPTDRLPSSLHNSPNVAKVSLGGKDFFAVMGKTHVVD